MAKGPFEALDALKVFQASVGANPESEVKAHTKSAYIYVIL